MTHTLITGANRGLGAGLAAHFADRPLILTAREPSGDGKFEQLDISDERSVVALATRLRDHGVKLSALVNNGAIYVHSDDPGIPKKTLATNVFGTLHLIDALLPLFAHDGGQIVNVSSAMGALDGYSPEIVARFNAVKTRADVHAIAHDYLVGTPGFKPDPYAVSKTLVNAFTRVLATELAPKKISVVAVSPGWVRTEMGGPIAPRGLEEGVASLAWPLEHSVETGRFCYDGKEIPY